jgi:hypothetical protein
MKVSTMQVYEMQHSGRCFVFTDNDIEVLENGKLLISASDEYGTVYSFQIDQSSLVSLRV